MRVLGDSVQRRWKCLQRRVFEITRTWTVGKSRKSSKGWGFSPIKKKKSFRQKAQRATILKGMWCIYAPPSTHAHFAVKWGWHINTPTAFRKVCRKTNEASLNPITFGHSQETSKMRAWLKANPKKKMVANPKWLIVICSDQLPLFHFHISGVVVSSATEVKHKDFVRLNCYNRRKWMSFLEFPNISRE